MKKILFLFLSVVLTLGIFCSMPFTETPFKITAQAAWNGTCGKNLQWTLNDKGTMTISGTGNMKSYTAEEDVPWHTHRNKIKKLVIKNGVNTISNYAFTKCGNLKSITFPESITKVNGEAFYDFNLDYLFIGNDYLMNNLRLGVCAEVKNVVIGDKVTMIPEMAFNGTNTVVSVTIGDGVKDIGSLAFCNNKNLTTVRMGKSVKFVSDAFYGCSKIKNIHIDDLAAWCKVSFGDNYMGGGCNPLEFGGDLYSKGKLVKNLVIPGTVKKISDMAFVGCGSIESVTIPDSVTILGDDAFYSCKKLKTVKIGNGVKRIGASAFSYCDNLTSVAIGKSVKEIGDYAFKDCNNLKYVFYAGNQSGWNNIYILGYNAPLHAAKRHYNCTDHTGGNWIVSKKATVNTPGSKYKICKVCNAKFKFTAIPQLKCAKPELKTLSNVAKGILFKWQKVNGADSYVIYRKTGSGSWVKLAQNIKTNTYTDKTAKEGVVYKYTVKAKNEAGLSGYNATGISIKRLTTPALKSVSAQGNGVTINWNTVTGASGYYVMRKTGNGSWQEIATVKGNGKVSYLDKKAQKGVTYVYTVKAYWSKSVSGYNTTGLKVKVK